MYRNHIDYPNIENAFVVSCTKCKPGRCTISSSYSLSDRVSFSENTAAIGATTSRQICSEIGRQTQKHWEIKLAPPLLTPVGG